MMRLPGGNNILGNEESNLGEHHEGIFSDVAKHRTGRIPSLRVDHGSTYQIYQQKRY